MTDEELIKRTLWLARKGRGRVSPNPMVGAILVKDNRILAQGYHKLFGGAHAEVEVLNALKGEATGSTLYVNLEPCSHYGKQPPCVDAIVKSGINRVVIGSQDPNPAVAGKGIQHLREQGIEVQVGVAEDACKELNEAYFKHIVTQFPFVTAKIAQTLDGRIAASNGNAQWITSEASRRLGHKMRAEHDAILVGIGTVLADDPQLTVRLAKGEDPKRIV
ncbi:bifunctional diaminohydroxyphosphoribosylaminopyrimidine deaminase/5-amino-6-(5-phosphoribosylamino)uracil reductase RibD, partial [candidate division KSB1 bacterium]|nr:bifunctional diaminohydroxyphosphoribosylaminopyrimidine deaminase/5-amino-6-(5-phosphoribosylamino)uracil reductase RibD [candidate division KSB1 bacterium]NIR70017.1 bifunctional diaminohydroxyphosphoribosylaminopyrimidine deaminase/5-amino-6-(5-phosphoribosylamino)uracil reductase RibD [candidate division KSB1 bacterium]NIS23030.1 bifunctional diaminohydroxyphosphoribosylaminopyrimidine deaminase/5-amino-6-(5-phosphoribosylamino)uracil reductase RibD [candidate division KSB1 bacterium]NIT6